MKFRLLQLTIASVLLAACTSEAQPTIIPDPSASQPQEAESLGQEPVVEATADIPKITESQILALAQGLDGGVIDTGHVLQADRAQVLMAADSSEILGTMDNVIGVNTLRTFAFLEAQKENAPTVPILMMVESTADGEHTALVGSIFEQIDEQTTSFVVGEMQADGSLEPKYVVTLSEDPDKEPVVVQPYNPPASGDLGWQLMQASLAEPTPTPEPFWVNPETGQLEAINKDTGAYEPLFAAETFETDAETGWVTGFDADGQVTGVFDPETGQRFIPTGGNLKMWDEAQARFKQVVVEINNQPVNVKAHELHVTDLGIVAEHNGGATALIDPQTGEVFSLINQVYLKDQTFLTPEGKLVVWDGADNQWVPAVQVKDGTVIAWDGQQFKPLTTFGETPVLADEAIELPQGWAFMKDGQMTAFEDRNGKTLTAVGGEVAQGWTVYRLENNQLVESEQSVMDWLIKYPGHDTLELDPQFSSNFGISLTLNEAALQKDWEIKWDDPRPYVKFWTNIAYNRMKDEGLLPEDMIYSEFKENLDKGNIEIKLRQLSAWNVRTGEVETFVNIPVKRLRSYNTQMYQQNFGVPALPMEKTRYSPNYTSMYGEDVVYDPQTATLWLIEEHNAEAQLSLPDELWGVITRVFSPSVYFRIPYTVLMGLDYKTSSGGRICLNTKIIGQYGLDSGRVLDGQASWISAKFNDGSE